MMSQGLILTVDSAGPPISGAELRNWQNALALSEMGHVALVSHGPFCGPSRLLDGRIECCALTGVDEKPSPDLARRRSSIDVRLTLPALTRLIALVERFRPDVVVVEGIPLFPYLAYLRPLTSMLVLDMHNIESDLAALNPQKLRSRLLAPFLGPEPERIRRLEREAIEIVDRVWVCSQSDRERVHALFGEQAAVAIVPNSIPRLETLPAELPPSATRAEGWPVILFVGHLGYAPNVAAVDFLAKQVFPLIRSDFPAARLIVAGRSPTAKVVRIAANSAIELVTNPDDLTSLYAKSHLAVVPLFIGGGTRIKILEAMAHGLAVVATPLAVEGLDLADGTEVLLSDTSRGLADHVRRLCLDPVRFEMLRKEGWRTVMARYGPSEIAEAVRNDITAASTRGRGPA